MKRKVDFYSGFFWFFFSFVTCFESFRLKLGDIHQPGPGFFPFWTGLFMGIFSLLVIYQAIRGREERGEKAQAEQTRGWNIILILGALTAYVISLEKVGFLINTFLFISLMLKAVYPQSWRTTILGALVTAMVAHFVFNILLKAQIPSGILGF
jgi:putative tricarboxylic transport membrane protein